MIISVRVMPKTDLFTGVNIVMFGAATSYALYWLLAPNLAAVNFPTDITGWISASFLGVISTACATAAMFAGIEIIGAVLALALVESRSVPTVEQNLPIHP